MLPLMTPCSTLRNTKTSGQILSKFISPTKKQGCSWISPPKLTLPPPTKKTNYPNTASAAMSSLACNKVINSPEGRSALERRTSRGIQVLEITGCPERPSWGDVSETRDVFWTPTSFIAPRCFLTCFGVLVLNDAGWGFEHVLNTISKDDDSYASLTIALPNNPLVCGRIHIYLTSSNLSWFLTFSRKEVCLH